MNQDTQETPKKPRKRKSIDGKTNNPLALRILKGEVEQVLDANMNYKYRLTIEIPLDRYYKRGEISGDQYDAGERLYIDHCLAFAERSILERIIEGGGRHNGPEDRRTAADRFQKVMIAIGRISAWLARRVVVEGRFLDAVHDEFGWAKKNTGMDRLKEALDEIAIAYDEMDNYERKRREKTLASGL